MIRKVVIRNIKAFERQEFGISGHLVIVGPNNAGKTTLLQAIAAWSEIASVWADNNPDLARDKDGTYPITNLNLLRFYSVPLASFDQLWKNKNVNQPASIWLHTDHWKIGFEVTYDKSESVAIRPAKEVKETDLDAYLSAPLIPVYIPSFSGLDTKEPLYDPIVIPFRQARMQAGSVLRNLIHTVYQDGQKWQLLQNAVGSFFGYELLPPSASAEISVGYRHSEQDTFYDLSSAASGFLQILVIYASLLAKNSSVVLIDEPDAHLHILLQGKIYRDLREYCLLSESQLIIATHSETLINAVEPRHLRILIHGQAKTLRDESKHTKDSLLTALTALDNLDYTLALSSPGILYAEGQSDIDILLAWAAKLAHPLVRFLERPFWKQTVHITHHGIGIKSEKHFESLKLVKDDIIGVELRDKDKLDIAPPTRKLKSGLVRIFWKRYEIESYLVHPSPIGRFVEAVGGKLAARRANSYMKRQLPPIIYDSPFEYSEFVHNHKAKIILSHIFQEVGMHIRESEYYQIAKHMRKDEIHPEVKDTLDEIAHYLNI